MKFTVPLQLSICLLGSVLRGTSPLKVLFVGDSITHHSPSPEKLGWSGNWGMAASSESRDYVHLFLHQLAQQTGLQPSLTIEAEGGGTLRGKMEALGRITAAHADLAVIQMGENDKAATEAAFSEPYGQILAAVRRGNSTARILCCGVWSPPHGDPEKDRMIRALCTRYQATFVDLSRANADASNQAKSEPRFSNAGVNWHPGDQGMAVYAKALEAAYAAVTSAAP